MGVEAVVRENWGALAGCFASERFLAYSVDGIGPKAAGIVSLTEQFFPGRAALTLTDVGGNAGFVGLEVLSRTDAFRRFVNVDPDCDGSERATAAVLRYLPELAGKYERVVSRAEDYGFPNPSDLVTAIGSLLYVPREKLAGTLTRIWDSLHPSGVLAVYENMRGENYRGSDEYGLMFEPDELDGYLSALGSIRYFSARGFREMQDPGGKTVFRVVQKN